MSASYYECPTCHGEFSDCGDFYYCEADHYFCSEKCAKPKPFHHKSGDYIGCCLCRKEVATDELLLKALMKHFKLDYVQAFEIYKKQD